MGWLLSEGVCRGGPHGLFPRISGLLLDGVSMLVAS